MLNSFKGINIYYYIFFNIETRKIYIIIFIRIFKVLKNIRRKSIKFPYIYSGDKRLRIIIIDIYKKQIFNKFKLNIY